MDDTESAQELDWQWDFEARELVSSRWGTLLLLVFPSPPRKNRQTPVSPSGELLPNQKPPQFGAPSL